MLANLQITIVITQGESDRIRVSGDYPRSASRLLTNHAHQCCSIFQKLLSIP